MNKALHINVITKLIFEQKKLISKRNDEKTTLLAKIEEIEAMNSHENKYIDSLKKELPEPKE